MFAHAQIILDHTANHTLYNIHTYVHTYKHANIHLLTYTATNDGVLIIIIIGVDTLKIIIQFNKITAF